MARTLTLSTAAAWLCLLAVGMHGLIQYEKTPAEAPAHPAEWPEDAALRRSTAAPTLLMFAHPRCPCTRASLVELARLMDEHATTARIVFYRPSDDDSAAWTDSSLVRRARSDARVAILFDPGGVEAKRFGATTSGCCLLYDREGRLSFSGGVTSGRGHVGPSQSQRLLADRLGGATSDLVACPSYGCVISRQESDR